MLFMLSKNWAESENIHKKCRVAGFSTRLSTECQHTLWTIFCNYPKKAVSRKAARTPSKIKELSIQVVTGLVSMI
jgi:hypothetical protein